MEDPFVLVSTVLGFAVLLLWTTNSELRSSIAYYKRKEERESELEDKVNELERHKFILIEKVRRLNGEETPRMRAAKERLKSQTFDNRLRAGVSSKPKYITTPPKPTRNRGWVKGERGTGTGKIIGSDNQRYDPNDAWRDPDDNDHRPSVDEYWDEYHNPDHDD
jgi:hypothetical protein